VARLRAAGCVFAEDEARLLNEAAGAMADRAGALEAMLRRREAGEPLEYVVGWVEFCGLRIGIDPGVFIPRQRTALLVREAAARTPAGGTVVDLACGSGAVGLAVSARVPGIALHAVDIEPAAVRCARRNLAGTVYEGDLFDPLPDALRGHVDVLVANVPYVPSEAVALMPREAREYEPRVTLDGGTDGLDLLRRAAYGAREWLVPGGYLLVEIGEDQSDAARAAFADAGLDATVVSDPELYATVTVGRSPGSRRG
jgi:release factor glutamine methyltransferase